MLPLTLQLAAAATLQVPADHATVQAAANAAAPGDTIVIAAGTYAGDVILSRDVTIVGAGMNDTILEDGTSSFGFTVDGASVTVTDLTVRATTTEGVLNLDNGAYAELARVKIRGGRSSYYYGAGLRVYSSSTLVLTDSIVCDNREDGGSIYGAGSGCRAAAPSWPSTTSSSPTAPPGPGAPSRATATPRSSTTPSTATCRTTAPPWRWRTG